MFEIRVEQRQYQTYILSDRARGASLEVVPERGGIITRWQVGEQTMLYLDAERFAHPELTVRGGIPILFPICGNLPDSTYTHRDQAYTLKQHGFARDLPWTVVDQRTDGGATLVLTLTSNDQTRACYPFEFELRFTYSLQGQQLLTQQCYTNRSPEPMPFSIGFHPYFQVGDKSRLLFDIPATEFQDQRTQALQGFAGRFDLEQEELDLAFRHPSRSSASVTDSDRQCRLTLDYSPSFSTLVFWTLKGKPFYCLEPWSAPRNAMSTGDRLLHLEPGGSLETYFNLSVEFL